jgi:hypothetical protein
MPKTRVLLSYCSLLMLYSVVMSMWATVASLVQPVRVALSKSKSGADLQHLLTSCCAEKLSLNPHVSRSTNIYLKVLRVAHSSSIPSSFPPHCSRLFSDSTLNLK